MQYAGFFDPIWEFSGLISQEQCRQIEGKVAYQKQYKGKLKRITYFANIDCEASHKTREIQIITHVAEYKGSKVVKCEVVLKGECEESLM